MAKIELDLGKLIQKNRGLEKVTVNTERNAALAGFPVVANTSGLIKGDVITEIGDYEVVKPTIGGVKRDTPTIVMACAIRDANGKEGQRLIFLSSLIRKTDLSADFKGMVGEEPAFEGNADFTNAQWIEAFKASTPFRIDDVQTLDRTVNMREADGSSREQVIRVKELILVKEAAASDAGASGATASDSKNAGGKSRKA